jgi:hypothetical protein
MYCQKTQHKGVQAGSKHASAEFWVVSIVFAPSNQGKGIENRQKGMWNLFLREIAA